MYVTRLKKGYRIRLSDSEYEALTFVANFGTADCDGTDIGADFDLSVRALNIIYSGGAIPSLDEDRRS